MNPGQPCSNSHSTQAPSLRNTPQARKNVSTNANRVSFIFCWTLLWSATEQLSIEKIGKTASIALTGVFKCNQGADTLTVMNNSPQHPFPPKSMASHRLSGYGFAVLNY